MRDSNNKLIAFLFFSIRNGTLKLPYFYYNNNLDEVIKVINYHIIKWKIKTFTTYHSALSKRIMELKTVALFRKKTERNYLISKSLNEKLLSLDVEIQDGDGDCVFT